MNVLKHQHLNGFVWEAALKVPPISFQAPAWFSVLQYFPLLAI